MLDKYLAKTCTKIKMQWELLSFYNWELYTTDRDFIQALQGCLGRYPWQLQSKLGLNDWKIYKKKTVLGANEPKLIWILKTFGFFGWPLTIRGDGPRGACTRGHGTVAGKLLSVRSKCSSPTSAHSHTPVLHTGHIPSLWLYYPLLAKVPVKLSRLNWTFTHVTNEKLLLTSLVL